MAAPATDDRTITRRGQGSPDSQLLVWRMPGFVSLFIPLASTSPSGKWV